MASKFKWVVMDRGFEWVTLGMETATTVAMEPDWEISFTGTHTTEIGTQVVLAGITPTGTEDTTGTALPTIETSA